MLNENKEITHFFNKDIKSANHFIAIGYILLWGISFTVSMSLVRGISSSVSIYGILFFRCVFVFLAFSPFAAWKLSTVGKQEFQISQPWLYAIRIILIVLAMGCTYYAYRHLSLATASAIGFSGPLFTSVFDKWILKNKIGLRYWLIIILGYLGIIVVIQPNFFELRIPVIIGLLANLFTSASIIALKNLSRTETNTAIIFYTNLATLLLSIFLLFGNLHIPSLRDLYHLIGIGLSATFSQYCYVQSLRIAEPYFIAPFEYNRLIFAIIGGYVFFGEVPLLSVIVGALIIAGSNYTLMRLNAKSAVTIQRKIRID